jgi:uncharacterized protein
MRIVITGGTGFVGKALTNKLLELGHEVIILTRKKTSVRNSSSLTYVEWLTNNSNPVRELHNIDVVVNLAGESINSGRWTSERKDRILQSRLNATEEILAIMSKLEQKPKVLINASAIGYYGTSLTETFTEEQTIPGTDFLATTVKLWEEKASEASKSGIRTALCRFGIILDKKEGALPKMALPYQFFVGGTVGSGQQWMSWIHLDDVINAMIYIMENDSLRGPINFTAPQPVKMVSLGKALGKALRRPHWIPAPAIALRIALGEMSLLVLEGQQVVPKKLEESGYQFTFTKIEDALENIYKS